MRVKATPLGFGVGLLSASALMMEILLTRLFSVILLYHYAFVAVAVAMLGLGGGGLLVYLNRERFSPEKFPNWLNFLGQCFTVFLILDLVFILSVRVPNWLSVKVGLFLALIFAAATVPFLFAGALFSLLVWRFASSIHRVYYYDLVGAALGSLTVLPALQFIGAPNAVLFAAILAALSSLLLGWSVGVGRARLLTSTALFLGLSLLVVANLQGRLLDIRYAKGVSTGAESYARWNPISRVCVHPSGPHFWIRIDCDAATEVSDIDFWVPDRTVHAAEFSSAPEDLAHVLRPKSSTLVIGSGGGRDVARALAHGSQRVVAVEINPLIARNLMLGTFLNYSHRLFERPEVQLVVDDARSAIQRSTEHFDIIQANLIDTWASTAAGAFALTESYLYTITAFEHYLQHLTPNGILIITRWEFVPPRQALRVVSVGRAAMERLGVPNPAGHFVVVQKRNQTRRTAVLMKLSAFTRSELDAAREFVNRNDADVRSVYLRTLQHRTSSPPCYWLRTSTPLSHNTPMTSARWMTPGRFSSTLPDGATYTPSSDTPAKI